MRLWDQQMQVPDNALILRRQEQRRRARRLRLVPFVSNILSVAALMTVGFIIQALLPSLNATTTTSAVDELHPAIEQVMPVHSAGSEAPIAVPKDSAAAE